MIIEIARPMGRRPAARSSIRSTPMPDFTRANVDQGKKAFLTIGCAKCHGDDGRGQMASNVGDGRLGQPDQGRRPDLRDAPRRDRAAGHLPPHRRGHQRHADAVVPRYAQGEPETIWNLVAYVLHVADSRREGTMPDSGFLEDGLLKPLPGVKPAASAREPPAGDAHAAAADRAGTRPWRSANVPRSRGSQRMHTGDKITRGSMAMDLQAKQQELEAAQGPRSSGSRPRSTTAQAGPAGEPPSYYTAYYATAGFLLGIFGAMASLLFNVVGARSPARARSS